MLNPTNKVFDKLYVGVNLHTDIADTGPFTMISIVDIVFRTTPAAFIHNFNIQNYHNHTGYQLNENP